MMIYFFFEGGKLLDWGSDNGFGAAGDRFGAGGGLKNGCHPGVTGQSSVEQRAYISSEKTPTH